MPSKRCALAMILSALCGSCVCAAETRVQPIGHTLTSPLEANADKLGSFDDIQKPTRLAQQSQQTTPSSIENTGNPATAPLKWVGLLLGESKSGAFGCTAQFIAPRVILTAAHCVQNNVTREWFDASKMHFLLQYQNKSYSRQYQVLCAARLNNWIPTISANATDWDKLLAIQSTNEYDFAMALVDGESITGTFSNVALDAIGQYHFATEIGYPAAIFKGNLVQQDLGFLGVRFFPKVLALWHQNENMTEGTSGGAWIANFDTAEGRRNNVIVGLTSFRYDLWPRTTFGPYLTKDQFSELFNYVSGGCQ